VAVLVTAMVFGLCGAASSTAATTEGVPAKKVILVLAPYLQWSDVSESSTPALWELMQDGAAGNVNVRNRTSDGSDPASPLESALGLSSGTWARPSYAAAGAFNADEIYDGGVVSGIYERYCGTTMGEAAIGYLGLSATQDRNIASSLDVTLGVLGGTVRDAGGVTAAIGNSDSGHHSRTYKYLRPAAVVAMDRTGLVMLGDVSADVLKEDAGAPYGVRTDLEAFGEVLEEVEQAIDAQAGPALVVLDAGDKYRARRAEWETNDAVSARQHEEALKSLDAVVRMASEDAGSDTVVMVVSQSLSTSSAGGLQGLGPVVISGSGWSGYLTSASTHRTGVVTNADVTATVLEVLGLKRPVEVLGNAMTSVSAPASAEEKSDWLESLNLKAIAIDQPKTNVLVPFISLVIAILVGSLLLISAGSLLPERWFVRSRRILKAGVLLCLAVPASGWLMFLAVPYPASPGVAVAALTVVAFVLWVAAMLADRRWGARTAVIGLTALTALVLLVDQFTGATLSFTGFFSYSPLLAARFYGMGNEAASIVVGSAMVGVALALDQWRESGFSRLVRRYGSALIGLAVVVAAAAPSLGANVGVAIWGIVGFAVLWLLLNGYRLTWKFVVAVLVVIVGLLGVFIAIDLLGGGEITHLGRALQSADEGGIGQLMTIVVRKAQTNMRIFGVTRWSWVLVGVLALLAVLRVRPNSGLKGVLAENPAFAHAITATLIAGLFGFFTEDSGIVIPALVLLYTGMAIIWLMLSGSGASGKGGASG
jgi:hypothetical protein